MGGSYSTAEGEEDMSIQSQSIERRNLSGLAILKEILKTIKLDEVEISENRRILQLFLDGFIQEMKNVDELFAKLFQKFYYTGSFYTKLRISRPDEFDINIALKMPVKSSDVEIIFNSQTPSYAKYKVSSNSSVLIPKFSKFLSDNYLILESIRTWIQSVVDRAKDTYRKPSSIRAIRFTASGPARGVQLVKLNGDVIDIDLVPAIEGRLKDGVKPPGIREPSYAKLRQHPEFFLVPKPYVHSNSQAPVNKAEIERLWRVHYPLAEDHLLINLGCAKPIIRLLKLLRDKENWKILASYYLKTVVMWMVIENANKSEYWKENNMFDRFLEALKKLQQCVANRRIQYFFSSNYNLIGKMTAEQSNNISNRLNRIIRDIERDQANLWAIYKL